MPILHGYGIDFFGAYDMYPKTSEGRLDIEWTVQHLLEFLSLCDLLSFQMLLYNQTKRTYKGDTQMRVCTKQWKGDFSSQKKKKGYLKKEAESKES